MSATAATPAVYFPDVTAQVVFDAARPRPQFVFDSLHLKALVAALEPGQQIPAHPEALAVYYFVAGEGEMEVDGRIYAVAPGALVVTPDGARRGLRAASRLVFLAVKQGE